MNVYKSKADQKNIATDFKEENLLLALSHFSQFLKRLIMLLDFLTHILKAPSWKMKQENYSQTCIRQPLLEPLKSGHFGLVVVLQNTFIKQPLSKCGCFWQVFSFFSHSKICLNKDLQLHVLVPFLKIKNVLSYFSFLTFTY